ncbi:hypothetical protein TNCV_3161 [Trichonephila clavipes]|nr:hypothetical protein TNCV_3161 [Trichonephila clavipes]
MYSACDASKSRRLRTSNQRLGFAQFLFEKRIPPSERFQVFAGVFSVWFFQTLSSEWLVVFHQYSTVFQSLRGENNLNFSTMRSSTLIMLLTVFLFALSLSVTVVDAGEEKEEKIKQSSTFKSNALQNEYVYVKI